MKAGWYHDLGLGKWMLVRWRKKRLQITRITKKHDQTAIIRGELENVRQKVKRFNGTRSSAMKYDIYRDPLYRSEFDASSEWQAIEKWLDGMEAGDLGTIMDCEAVVYVSDEHGNTTEFTLGRSMNEFVANRVDGKPWLPNMSQTWSRHNPSRTTDPADLYCHGVGEPNTTDQTFHLGVSCYGPNKDGKFCGTISVESITIHSETYNTLDEARQESLGKLLEYITVTLGFSRTEAIEKLGKECNDRRKNADSDERTSVDG